MASGVETLLGCARLLRKNLVEPASLLALSRSRHLSYNPLYNYACSSWLWEEEETENLAPRSLGGVVVHDTFVDSFGGSCGSPSGSTSSFVAGIPLVVKDNIAVAGHVMQALLLTYFTASHGVAVAPSHVCPAGQGVVAPCASLRRA